MSVRVPQGNRTKRRKREERREGGREGRKHTYKDTYYYKELGHVIMEADKAQHLQYESASWRASRANAVVPVQSRQAQGPEELIFLFKPKSRKKPGLKAVRQEECFLV